MADREKMAAYARVVGSARALLEFIEERPAVTPDTPLGWRAADLRRSLDAFDGVFGASLAPAEPASTVEGSRKLSANSSAPAPVEDRGETGAPIVRSDWTCEAGTKACPGTQGSLAKDWICTACGRKAHAPKTWREKGLTEKPKTYEPSSVQGSGTGEGSK